MFREGRDPEKFSVVDSLCIIGEEGRRLPTDGVVEREEEEEEEELESLLRREVVSLSWRERVCERPALGASKWMDLRELRVSAVITRLDFLVIGMVSLFHFIRIHVGLEYQCRIIYRGGWFKRRGRIEE